MAAPDRRTKGFRVSSTGVDDQAADQTPAAKRKAMIWLKGCPKCRGDMHYDPLVEEYVCLQCGLAVERLPTPPAEPPAEALTASAVAGEPPQPDQENR
jgi:hypothetical protein